MEIENDPEGQIRKMVTQLLESGANTIFLSPWSDGEANYNSKAAEKSAWGKVSFVERLIAKANQAKIKTYAWFVVGKDNFPASKHPEWQAITILGKPYFHNDEPGVEIPVASLANENYINYHLQLVQEVNSLPIAGWVISEPLLGWGDRYDNDYTDFSDAVKKPFIQKWKVDPVEMIKNQKQEESYPQWVDYRAKIVTNFVVKTMEVIRTDTSKKIVITTFIEPDATGKLKTFGQIKEWLGMDIMALAEAKPDYVEIQGLFADFEFPQSPTWLKSMYQQFKEQLNSTIPILFSVQGFGVSPDDFQKAVRAARDTETQGISFYAYHTLTPTHWQTLPAAWK